MENNEVSTKVTVKYKKLGSGDFNAYRTLRLDCLKRYPDNFGTLYEEELAAASLKLEKVIKSTIGESFVLGAFLPDNRIVGSCGFMVAERVKTRHLGEIIQMYVLPEYSGLAIGAALLGKTIELAFHGPYVEQLMLGVVESNDKARSLYSRFGFREYGRFENYFKLGNNYETLLLLKLVK